MILVVSPFHRQNLDVKERLWEYGSVCVCRVGGGLGMEGGLLDTFKQC